MAEELPHSTQPRGVQVKSVIGTNEQGCYDSNIDASSGSGKKKLPSLAF
jgi:hypothetical protein